MNMKEYPAIIADYYSEQFFDQRCYHLRPLPDVLARTKSPGTTVGGLLINIGEHVPGRRGSPLSRPPGR